MIDHTVKDISYLCWETLQSNPLLDFKQKAEVDTKTGEVKIIGTGENDDINEDTKKKPKKLTGPNFLAFHKNLRFEVFINPKTGKIRIYLKGSLHKYYNDGIHNYNEFNIGSYKWVLNDLYQKFGIDPCKSNFRHLEYGLNLISLPFPTALINENMLFESGKGKPFKIFKYKAQDKTSDFKTTDKRNTNTIKSYDKAKHQDQEGNIYRLECKTDRASLLKSIGLTHTNDLLNPDVVFKLGEKLISFWDDIVIFDWTIRENELSKDDQMKLKDWSNQKYWSQLNNQTRDKNRNKFSRELAQYRKIVQDHSDNVHQIIKEALVQNWCKITTFNSVTQILPIVQDDSNIIQDLAPIPEPKKLEVERRFCKASGIDISHQKKGSVFVRESTLRKMKNDYDPLMYDFLKSKHGPTDKQSFNEELKIIAHYFRNADSNKRAIKKAQEIRKTVKLEFAVKKYKSSLFPFENENKRTAEG